MRRVTWKLPRLLQGIRFWYPFSSSHISIFDENADRARDAGPQESNSIDATEETKSTKFSARERLNHLFSFRVSFAAISFTSSTTHRGGGKAKVVQATVRRDAGNEEVVAVKKLKCHNGMKIQKLSNEFVHEVEILVGLSHENIVRIIGEFLATGEWEIPERISLPSAPSSGTKAPLNFCYEWVN
ncbi:hypothetical protein M407DRAFT_21873 [Tulasnella calospora MUT 4182]|uniref:Serine-threonine/tyrosine-protein kinase catalytic domain-containing protein n=1 Tax=Tulasnella calospora MUT 4182 TaxID=1051891 RepID=A0A0C3M5P1_9AGAM|nr:hypothetical protein M407DRAFT_21873 [Tulasnella calospora MUT 4182]